MEIGMERDNRRMGWQRAGVLIAVSACLMLGCRDASKESEQADTTSEVVLARVNGEVLTESDFDRSQAWLPSFARQLESNSNLEISRYWSLIQLMLLSQDAVKKSLLSDAERSLAIKEALAEHNRQYLIDTSVVIRDEDVEAYRVEHADTLMEPAAYTVNYALVKTEKRVEELYLGWHFAHSAQLGYNFTTREPVPENRVAGSIQSTNERGRNIDGKHFSYVYVRAMQDDKDSPGQIGPFTLSDDVLFSCKGAMERLEAANLFRPIHGDLACSGQWRAFVVPIWKREAYKMTEEKARQVAIEALRNAVMRDAF